jgi:hypothetical protein
MRSICLPTSARLMIDMKRDIVTKIRGRSSSIALKSSFANVPSLRRINSRPVSNYVGEAGSLR